MKRTFTLFAAFLAIGAVDAAAQSNAAAIEMALMAAPARAREDATVIRWNADQSYETLKEGTNRIVCYDRSDEPRRPAFAVQCTSLANLPRVAQSRKFRADAGDDADAERALVAAAEESGTRIEPEYGSMWYSMNGQDAGSARVHLTVAVPGATAAQLGLPTNGRAGGLWLMAEGTTTAHLMVPN